jgi:hypothetical protein
MKLFLLLWLCTAFSFTSICQLAELQNKFREDYINLMFDVKPGQLVGLELNELRFLRNEIFARKGYTFKSDDLQLYFEAYSWYSPKYDVNEIYKYLNIADKNNIALIKEREERPLTFKLFVSRIPNIKSPYSFECSPSVLPFPKEENWWMKEFVYGNGTVCGLIKSENQKAYILYGFPSDVFYPIILTYDLTGEKLKETTMYDLRYCSDLFSFSSVVISINNKDKYTVKVISDNQKSEFSFSIK